MLTAGNGTGQPMAQLAVAFPALASLIHPHNRSLVAPDTVFLHNFSTMVRQGYCFRNEPRMEGNHVFHPIYGFPHKVHCRITVGKMTVNTFDTAMRSGMLPCSVLLSHHVTAGAKIGGLGFCKELRRPDEDKQGNRQAPGHSQNK
jgi:hypothetical protein